tara:strand:- start:767 stop:1465 length:699 start_codon:yes stop_codon:yes gene_type:complete
MRAIFSRGDSFDDTYLLSDDRASHLIKSCRIKKGELVKILCGDGLVKISEVDSVTRRDITLKIKSSEKIDKRSQIDLLLGLAKKDSFELSLKNACEIGIGKIYPYECEYHSWKIKNRERLLTLLESAMIQSNNPYMVKLEEEVGTDGIHKIVDNYDYVVLATLKNIETTTLTLDKSKKYLLVIGPEGGLSEDEEDYFLSLHNSVGIHVPTNILRAPNAVSVLSGFLYGKFDA